MADKLPLVITSGIRSELPAADVLAVNVGQGIDTLTAGALDIGTANATGITVSQSAVLTTIAGGATVNGGDFTFNDGLGFAVTFFNATGIITQTGTAQVTFGGNVDANNGLNVAGANLTVATGLDADVLGGSVNITDPVGGNIGDLSTAGQALVLSTNTAVASQVTQTTQANLAGGETDGMLIFDGAAAPNSIYGYISGSWVDLAATGSVPNQLVVAADTSALSVGQVGFYSGNDALSAAEDSALASATFVGVCLTSAVAGTMVVSGLALCDFGVTVPSAGESAYVGDAAAPGTLTNSATVATGTFVSEVGTVTSSVLVGALYKVILAPKSIIGLP